jgi:hypothetical protein
MIYMFNAIKVIDNSMINITYAWILNESRLRGHEINYFCILDAGIRADSSGFGFPRPRIIYFCILDAEIWADLAFLGLE